MAGTLFVVATPIGNLEDLSARALRVLRSVQLLAAEDTRHTAHLLQRFGITTPITSLHEHNETAKSAALIDRLQKGDDVALVSDAGTPGVSDPGAHLVRRAHDVGVRVEPIPGPSAVVSALSASGLSGAAFVFLGFPPTKAAERKAWMAKIRSSATVAPVAVFYEAPHRIQSTLAELAANFPGIDVLVARELTKAHEQLRFGPISSFTGEDGRGEYTVVMDIGRITESHEPARAPDAVGVAAEFGELTNNSGLTRRQAIAALSRKYAVPARQIFTWIDQGRSSAG
ncbi:MAG: 16S rRNA (cytidine(1402)-2'-O)-methyltransferase [Vicinamibacterales bacterium]